MCGIVGYTGAGAALPVLLGGLAALEYRGYDSAGVALVDDDGLCIRKRSGRLAVLAAELGHGDGHHDEGGAVSAASGLQQTGIGHTRWATHGAPEDRNAHPHTGAGDTLAVVHNGIIENHARLKAHLVASGHAFASDTDSEVLVHLVAEELGGQGRPRNADDLAAALRRGLRKVEGAFSLALVSGDLPGVIVAARRAAPLLLGCAEGATHLASDVAGLSGATDDVEALRDEQVAVLTPDGARVTDLDGDPATGRRFTVDWAVSGADLGSYDHFMLKEIHDQPTALRAPIAGCTAASGLPRLDAGPAAGVRPIERIVVLGCGTSAHAGMAAQTALEQSVGAPVTVELASEFRYRNPTLPDNTLVMAISQSGETADTIAATDHARRQGAQVLALTNTVGSTLTRDADMVLFTHAGTEAGVAATKAFTTQVAALNILALWLARERRRADAATVRTLMARLRELPEVVERTLLEIGPQVAQLAEELVDTRHLMLIGRHVDLPVALEGALKLKEVTYVTAEGYAAGEMKHGPIAVIEPGGPVIALATAPATRDKIIGNIAEVRARGAFVIAIAAEGDVDLKEHVDRVVFVPSLPEPWQPILTVLPLQLLGYHLAVTLGRDVDRPRNMAKTVTVE